MTALETSSAATLLVTDLGILACSARWRAGPCRRGSCYTGGYERSHTPTADGIA